MLSNIMYTFGISYQYHYSISVIQLCCLRAELEIIIVVLVYVSRAVLSSAIDSLLAVYLRMQLMDRLRKSKKKKKEDERRRRNFIRQYNTFRL